MCDAMYNLSGKICSRVALGLEGSVASERRLDGGRFLG